MQGPAQMPTIHLDLGLKLAKIAWLLYIEIWLTEKVSLRPGAAVNVVPATI